MVMKGGGSVQFVLLLGCHGQHLVGHGKGLPEFGEAVGGDKVVPVAFRCLREGAHNVDDDVPEEVQRGSCAGVLSSGQRWALCLVQVLQDDMRRRVPSFILHACL